MGGGDAVLAAVRDLLVLLDAVGSVWGLCGNVGGTSADADWVLKFWQPFGGAVRQNCFCLRFSK